MILGISAIISDVEWRDGTGAQELASVLANRGVNGSKDEK